MFAGREREGGGGGGAKVARMGVDNTKSIQAYGKIAAFIKTISQTGIYTFPQTSVTSCWGRYVRYLYDSKVKLICSTVI